MRWLFVQPKSFHCWEALGLGYLASTLKAAGEQVEFKSGFFDSDDEILAAAKSADIVGFGCTSPQMKHATYLAKRMKAWTVFGGVHPSVLPDETLECCDQVVVGEGESGVLQIAAGERTPIIHTTPTTDLDSLPPPDRQIIRQERNVAQAKVETGERIGSLFSSRGCPFTCKFCASHALWGRRVRFRSAENILDEFERIVRDFELDFVKFADDTFTIRRSLVEQFCTEKIRRGIRTSWGCNVRAGMLDMELAALMSRAGCREVWIGVESGSPRILEDVGKGISLGDIKLTFFYAQVNGIKTRAYMLLGSPMESRDDIMLSELLIDELRPDIVGWTILAPYPGTEYYDSDKHKNVDWSAVDEYCNTITRTYWMANEEIRKQQKRLVEKYATHTAPRHKV